MTDASLPQVGMGPNPRRKASRRRSYPQAHAHGNLHPHMHPCSTTGQASQSAPQLAQIGADTVTEDFSGHLPGRRVIIQPGDIHGAPPGPIEGDNPHATDENLREETKPEEEPATAQHEKCNCDRPYKEYYMSQKQQRQDAADKGWKDCAERLRTHDDAIVQAWKEEIDALLVFAGLFSAALTTFNVELYTSLRPDPGVDLTNQLLLQISAQLNGSTILSPVTTLSTANAPSTPNVWINALWFSALVSSLSAASIAIIVRQWLNHFVSPSSSDHRQAAQMHCLRYEVGLIPWRVPEILSILPILLLLSLVLFFIGLLILLWGLHHIVAAITTALVGALFTFFAFTTLAPSIRHSCPYKSPQALLTLWMVHRMRHVILIQMARRAASRLWRKLRLAFWRVCRHVPDFTISREKILSWLQSITPVIVERVATGAASACNYLWHPLDSSGRRSTYSTWRALEQGILHEEESANEPLRDYVLERVLSGADATLSDDSFLTDVVRPCIVDPLYKFSFGGATLNNIEQSIQSTAHHSRRGYGSVVVTFLGDVSAFATDGLHTVERCGLSIARCLKMTLETNNDTMAVAFEHLASLRLHDANASCTESDADSPIADVLSVLMSRLEKPIESNGLALPHEKVLFLLQYAREQIEIYPGGVYTIYSCAVALLVCASAPEACYQQNYRAKAWELVDRVFECALLGSRWIRPYEWKCLQEHIAFLLRKHEHHDLQNQLGGSVLRFMRMQFDRNLIQPERRWMPFSNEYYARCAMKLRETLKDYVDAESLSVLNAPQETEDTDHTALRESA